jgi:hypothetical protein
VAFRVLGKFRGYEMKFDVTWHGPVCDRYYAVEADTEEDAFHEVARALNENDEEWLRSHEVGERMNRRCEGWEEPCRSLATKSVQVKGGVRWFTIRLCDICYVRFALYTRQERSTGGIEARS